MGWGIELETTIFVSKVTKDQVESTIEQNEDLISMFERDIYMYATSNPRDVVSDDCLKHGEIISEIANNIRNIIDSYKECVEQNQMLKIIRNDLDKAIDC